MLCSSFANTARQAAASSYQPIILVLNLVYATIRTFLSPRPFAIVWEGLGVCVLATVQYMAYKGILEHAATTAGSLKSNSSELTGGKSLDVLGLAVLLQFGSLFSLRLVFWGICMFPVWGAYHLYRTFKK